MGAVALRLSREAKVWYLLPFWLALFAIRPLSTNSNPFIGNAQTLRRKQILVRFEYIVLVLFK